VFGQWQYKMFALATATIAIKLAEQISILRTNAGQLYSQFVHTQALELNENIFFYGAVQFQRSRKKAC